MKPDIRNIPRNPGVYFFYNTAGTLLYIGKAKNLRNRVRSYWSKSSNLDGAKRVMVGQVVRVECTILNNEREAILTEAALINRHLPPYNISLRDDKNWTYIVLTDKNGIGLNTVRGTKKMKGEYFGPYTNSRVARTIVGLLRRIVPLPAPNKRRSTIAEQLHYASWFRTAFGAADGGVAPVQSSSVSAREIRKILHGDTHTIKEKIRNEMRASAQRNEFERARVFRDKLIAIERIFEPQDVDHPLLENQDIIGVASIGKRVALSIMHVRGGKLLDTESVDLKNSLNETRAAIVEQFITQYYGRIANPPKVAVLPLNVSSSVTRAIPAVRFTVPHRGAKKRLSALAQKNAWANLLKTAKLPPLPLELLRLQTELELAELPRRIEAYDISNFAGQHAVGSMVVAVDGKLSKSEYRTFKIKTVRGSNDTAMMREVLTRRSGHDEWPKPDLILLDGGIPQLSVVYRTLRADWRHHLAALAKKNEELFVPGRAASIRLAKNDAALKLLMLLRNEAHRTARRYYRELHKKAASV